MKRKIIITVVAIALSVGLRLFSDNRAWVEQVYSNGLYKFMSSAFRSLLGWIPFSVGDVIYFLAGCWLLYVIIKGMRLLVTGQYKKVFNWSVLLSFLLLVSLVYLIFNIQWGLNYNRNTVATIYGLDTAAYTKPELVALNAELLHKVNDAREVVSTHPPDKFTKAQLFRESYKAYDSAALQFPQLKLKIRSAKPSIFSYLGNYMGFYGYYNPFTAEAQVNTTIPQFLLPYTTMHEIAHQLGYAKENEANFVGFLAAKSSGDPFFLYSTYYDLFLYANRELHGVDSLLADKYYDSLSIRVKSDIETHKSFLRKYRSKASQLVADFYTFYLMSNSQPKGMRSYNEVVSMLIAYRKKYGSI